MKNIVTEIYEGLEFVDTLDSDIKLLEYLDKHCKSFTSEFRNVPIYRGLSSELSCPMVIRNKVERIPISRLHRIYTKYKDSAGKFVDTILEDGGFPSRTKNACYTTTSTPEDFQGIGINVWNYCFMVGDYSYGYFSDAKHDANISANGFINFVSMVNEIIRIAVRKEEDIYDMLLEKSKKGLFKDVIETFKNTKITNKITSSMNNNEVIFNCSKYVLVPITAHNTMLLKDAGLLP